MPSVASGAREPEGRSCRPLPAEASTPSRSESTWVARQVEAMASAWARGQPVTAEEILARHPGIEDEAAIRLIYEEVCLRRESGQDVATAEVAGRFPRWKDELEILLGCDRLLRPLARVAVLPEIGADLGPFRLLAELGRGATGRTYLAAEPALAGRLVVLKVISDDQEEHLSLARLQHTHIIPLFSEHTFPDRGLRALCMPYLGGTSLARLLEAMAAIPPARRLGRHILEVLDRATAGRPAPTAPDGPYRLYLGQASYIQAVCWIGACLADALHCAHAHGLVHMDVKPSNVLIAADGLPMLLDFHLARRPIAAGERIADRIGGTPSWMAPEHRAALEAVNLGRPVPEPVDHRADLYALGLLLREALLGPDPGGHDPEGRARRRRHPEVSRGLEDLLAKCLAARPADRYPDAATLADDLRRHLNDLPLRGVPNRSLSERWRKWRRRQPTALVRKAAWYTLLSSLTLAIGLVVAFGLQRVQEIQSALLDGQEFASRGRFPEAIRTLGHGLELAETLPFAGRIAPISSLRDQLAVARRGQEAAELHHLADRVRFLDGLAPPAAVEVEASLRAIRAIWERRHLLLAPAGGRIDDPLGQRIRADLLELVTIWADLRTKLARPAEAEAARAEVERVLEEVRASCGPSFTIDRLRRSLAKTRGRGDEAPGADPAPRSPADHYDLGRSYLREGRFQAAAEEFRRALDERPEDFWSHFYRGICAYRLRQFPDAFAAFSICVALAPDRAQCYYNRALAAAAMGRLDQAVRDYGAALARDRNLAPALLNRGILSHKSGRHAEAIADFRRALEVTADPQMLGRIHYNLALAHWARGDRAAALAHAEQAIARGDPEARGLRERLRRLE